MAYPIPNKVSSGEMVYMTEKEKKEETQHLEVFLEAEVT
jgi:hypothetical protein